MSDLPAGWVRASLAEVVGAGLFSDGDWVESKDQDSTGEVRLLQLADIGEGRFRDRSDRHLTSESARALRCTYLQAGDVLVARMPEPLGRACRVPNLEGPAVTAVDVCILRPAATGVNPAWLMWAINAPQTRSRITALQAGTTRKRVSRRNLATVDMTVPPRGEQDRIVAAVEEQLSLLDAAVADTARAVDRARGLASQIIESAMVRIGEWTSLASYAASGGITDGPFGSRLKSSHYTSAGPRVVRLENIGVGEFIDQRTHISAEHFEELRKHEVEAGDLVVASLVSERLRACAIPVGLGPAIVKADCIRVRLKEGTDARFLNYALMRPSLRAFVAENVRGVGRSRLGLTNVRRVPVPLASSDLQRQVALDLEEKLTVLARTDAQGSKMRLRAAALRRSILAAAFSGRLVPQDPEDEPASVLLKRIRDQRAVTTPTRRIRTPAARGEVLGGSRQHCEDEASAGLRRLP